MTIVDTLLSDADHVDVKTAESTVTLREFLAGALTMDSPWVKLLFRAREVLARILRLREPEVPIGGPLRPEAISFTPGDKVAFFTVTAAEEDRYIVLTAADNHLSGHLIVRTDGDGHFEVITVVKYHNWTGPLYFNIIRPFHHVMVARMTRSGAAGPR